MVHREYLMYEYLVETNYIMFFCDAASCGLYIFIILSTSNDQSIRKRLLPSATIIAGSFFLIISLISKSMTSGSATKLFFFSEKFFINSFLLLFVCNESGVFSFWWFLFFGVQHDARIHAVIIDHIRFLGFIFLGTNKWIPIIINQMNKSIFRDYIIFSLSNPID